MKKLIYLSLITMFLSCGMEKLDKDEQENYTTFEIIKNSQFYDTVTYTVVEIDRMYYLVNNQTNLVDYRVGKNNENAIICAIILAMIIMIILLLMTRP